MSKVVNEKCDRIAYRRRNRPEAKNAIDKETHLALCEIWANFPDDVDELDVAIVTGTGDAFCAGMYLKNFVPEYVEATPQMIRDRAQLGLGGLPPGFHGIPKPVIAALNGWAPLR